MARTGAAITEPPTLADDPTLPTPARARPIEMPPGDPPPAGAPSSRGSLLRSWRSWLGLAISALFLIYAFRGQNLDEVWAALRRFDPRWLAPALLLFAMGVWVRAIRWSILLRPIAPARARDVLPILVAGYTANNILPLRTGELVRAYLLGQRFGTRKTSALATIAIERLFDGLTMLAFMLAATSVISFTTELRQLTLVAFLLFTALLVGLIALTLGGDPRDRLLQFAIGPLPAPLADRIERLAMSFLGGLGVFTRRADLILVALTSLVAWGFEASMYWTLARGFNADLAETIGPAAALLTTGVANLWTLIPAAPGYVGTFEAGVRLTLHDALGLPSSLALSYALVVHAALWFPITLCGAVVWWRQHLSLAQARGIDETADSTPSEEADGRSRPAPHRHRRSLPAAAPVPVEVERE